MAVLNDRLRFTVATAVGGAAAMVVFAWLLTAGTFALTEPQELGGFYDAQAHSFLEGRWDVDPEVVGLEGFVIDGSTYIYFGPVPALLRLPVVAFTDGFDGRLSVVSMLLAYLVLMVAVGRLSWAVRGLVLGRAPVGNAEAVMVGAVTFVVVSSTPLFLASRGWVFHEASLWGLALAMAAYDQLVRHQLAPSAARLAGISALAAAALLTRPAVGAGPTAALAVLVVLALVRRWRRRHDAEPASRSPWPALVLATAVPVLLSASVNLVKFDTLFGVPFDKQLQTRFDEERQATLEANDGNIFGPQFVPTALVQYLRPDALNVDRLLPWLAFPDERATVIGDVRFDLLDRSSSLPATMPALVVLAVPGAIGIARQRRRDDGGDPGLAVLGAPVLGAAAGFGAVLVIGYVANRYLVDAFPLVVIPALVGTHLALARVDGPTGDAAPAGRRRRVRRGRRQAVAAVAVVGALGIFGTGANLSLGLRYQRFYSPQRELEDGRERLVEAQARVDERLFGGAMPHFEQASELPTDADDGELVAVDDCAGLYRSDGRNWRPVARSPEAGRFFLDVRLDPHAAGRQPLLSLGEGPGRLVVVVRRVDPGRAVVAQRIGSGPWEESPPFALDGVEHRIEVVADNHVLQFDVWVDDRYVYGALIGPPPAEAITSGRAPGAPGVAPVLDGEVSLVPGDRDLCRYLVRRGEG